MSETNVSSNAISCIPYHLQRCPNCLKPASSIALPTDKELDCIATLFCRECEPIQKWYVCVRCNKQNAHIGNQQQLRRHFLMYHNQNKLAKVDIIESQQSGSDSTNSKPSYQFSSLKKIHDDQESRIRPCLLENFDRKENANYFSEEIISNNGIAYLIGRSCFNDNSIGSKIDALDIELNFAMSKLCLELTRGQRDDLSKILYLTTKKFTSVSDPSKLQIELPQTSLSIRQRYMEGINAVIPNLPHPDVKTVGEIAYVSLVDCVKDLFAHGVAIDEIGSFAGQVDDRNVSRLTKSVAAEKIYLRSSRLSETPDVTLCMLEWSDAFQPNTSSKQNRGSAFLKTVSFMPPENALGWSSSCYTYVVALGPAKSEREPAEKIFSEELSSFRNSPLPRVFCRNRKRFVSVYLELICVLQDQPERRKANYLAYGNSNFHARWGWSCDVKTLSKSLPSCLDCQKRLIENNMYADNCEVCLSWDMCSDRTDNLRTYTIPSNFPECSSENGLLRPFKLDYSLLKESVEKCHTKLMEGTWSKTTARAYLAVFCLNNETIQLIITRALNCKLLSEIENLPNGNEIQRLSVICPTYFNRWEYPSTWCRKLQLTQHVDTIMHLLFLGITKTLMMDCHSVLTTHNKLSKFLRKTEGLYEDVQKLSLSWCKALPYSESGKFGAHVSENYLACARLLQWFYQALMLIEEGDEYIDPVTPPGTWTKAINIQWLRRRGLPTAGNAATLRLRVENYLTADPTTLPNIPTFKSTLVELKTTIESWNQLLSYLMYKEMSSRLVETITRYIKIFLNNYSNLDKISCTEKYPVWIRHFNLLSLLNIPDIIKEYGPLRNLWEGGSCGEAIIASVKPEITMGLRTSWASSVLRKVMRKKAFTMIHQSAYINKMNPYTSRIEPSAVKRYSGLAEINYELRERKPISCLLQNDSIFVLFQDDNVIQVNVLNFEKEVLRLCYFEVTISTSVLQSIHDLTYDMEYGLLLPLLKIDDNANNDDGLPIYTIINRNWERIHYDKCVKLPTVL